MNWKYENHRVIFGVLVMLLLSYSSYLKAEDVYKCPNANGNTFFSDRPCTNGYRKEGKTWISVADYEKSQAVATDKSTNQSVKPVQNKPHEIPTVDKQQTKQPSTTQPTAWDEQMQAGKAAFAKLDIVEGEKHYISALELAKSFDEKDYRYNQTLMAIGNFADVSMPKGVTEVLKDKEFIKELDDKLPEGQKKKWVEEFQKREQVNLMAAEPFLKQAIEITEQARGAEHSSLLLALENLGKLYDSQARYRDAVPIHERYFSIVERKNVEKKRGNCSGINIKPTGMMIDETYFLLMSRGAGWAEAFLKSAIKCSEDANQANDPKLITPYSYLSQLYRGQGRIAEADKYYQKAQQLNEKNLQPSANNNPSDINKLWEMGGLAMGQEHYDDAEGFYQKALKLSEQIYGSENVKVIGATNVLAEFYANQKRHDKAESFYKRGLAIAQKGYDAEDEQLAWSFFKLGSYYDAYEKRFADAEPMFKNALAIWEKKYGYNHANVVDVRGRLINVYNAQGKKTEAEALSKLPAEP